jgi:thiosulfate dehydrogenase [quinone] large subunit
MDSISPSKNANGALVSLSLIWPLRLFMGFTFVYAGLQHLTDPSYFDPSKSGYIGHLVSQYAVGSPLHDFLLAVVAPNAVSFGWMVAVAEVLIGIATLAGFLFRLGALAGLMLNFTFFLSATWNAFPFYFGSDIVFVLCWLTLLLTGPQARQSLDGALARRFHSLSWLVTKPVAYVAPQEKAPQTSEASSEPPVPLAKQASLYPKQVQEVNKAFDRIKQQFVWHRETITILEFVRAFVISLGVDRNDTPRLLNGIEALINRKGVDTS